MKEGEVLITVLSKTLKKSEDELKQLLYSNGDEITESAVESVLNADAERIKRLQKEFETTGFNNGHKKGVGETMGDFEEKVRGKYGVSGDVRGIDLIDAIVLKNQKTTVNPDEVKKHPAYLELERSTVPKSEYNKVVGEFENFKIGLEKEKVLTNVHTKALDILRKLNPVIEDNPTVAKKRTDLFLKEFNSYDYEFPDGDDRFIVPIKDGKRITDKHGNTVTFENLAREIAESNFVLSQQMYRQSAGNQNGGGSSIPIPRNDEEYKKAILEEKDPAKRIQIKKAYEASQK